MSWPFDTTANVSAVISALGATVALCVAMATGWFAYRNLRINIVSAKVKYFEDFQKWADQLVNDLTEAIHLCDLDPKQVTGESLFDRRHRLRITLSAMIDKGRWFFPNIEVNDHGASKELGYRGYRHELLDGLVSAYLCLQRLDYRNRDNNTSVRDELTEAKRHFVGQVQKIVDPVKRWDEFDKINSVAPYRARDHHANSPFRRPVAFRIRRSRPNQRVA